jgi:hypothetical protein
MLENKLGFVTKEGEIKRSLLEWFLTSVLAVQSLNFTLHYYGNIKLLQYSEIGSELYFFVG